MKAIQFIGTQRSGSNLLRVMLHQHSRICAPHPPHILQHFYPLLEMYGDLEVNENFSSLIDDVCTLVELNPVSWHMQFDRDEVRRKCDANILPQVMKAVYELKAEKTSADLWCCKSMASVEYVNEIEASGIHPFYIHIYRDGRDVALSFMKAIVGEKHIYHLAEQWKYEQRLAAEVCRTYPERSFAVKYEEFILDPEKYIRTICDKLNIGFEPAMMDYASPDESKETASSGEMWRNLVKPVLKNNAGKFLEELSEEQIRIFESVAGDTLEQFDYKLYSGSPFVFTEANVRSFEELNKAGKSEARKKATAADLEKRKTQDTFLGTMKRKWQEFKTEKVG